VADLVAKGTLPAASVRLLILDEADKLVEKDFRA
jgi:superfamily II DNA/RNA helicase